ncbi:hypothetical protein [Nonomuraea sp. NPDC049725]|uniref:hypothetical protein n=1 Tax=Nonomuraea sp. NPDC049725 TaxID=3154508 RepID=UPI0034342FD7
MVLRSGFELAGDAASWGWRFYLRHFWIVAGLSMVPAVQRFAAITAGDDLPAAVNIAAEVLTAACRVVLLYVIVRLAVRAEPALRGLTPAALWQRMGEGIDRDRWAFATQFLVLGAAFTVLDVLPTLAVDQWAGQARDLVTALLVSVKNPTVIAFTFVWMTGVATRLMLSGSRRPAAG